MGTRSLWLAAAVAAVGAAVGCAGTRGDAVETPAATAGGAGERPAAVAAAPSAPAAEVGAAAESLPGAALFAERCARCHRGKADDVAARFRAAADPDRLEAQLRTFLETHGRADDAEDAQILAYFRQKAL